MGYGGTILIPWSSHGDLIFLNLSINVMKRASEQFVCSNAHIRNLSQCSALCLTPVRSFQSWGFIS